MRVTSKLRKSTLFTCWVYFTELGSFQTTYDTTTTTTTKILIHYYFINYKGFTSSSPSLSSPPLYDLRVTSSPGLPLHQPALARQHGNSFHCVRNLFRQIASQELQLSEERRYLCAWWLSTKQDGHLDITVCDIHVHTHIMKIIYISYLICIFTYYIRVSSKSLFYSFKVVRF
jgi:hypothetical protein